MKIADIDRVLLRYADTRSPAELSLLVQGVFTPEECAARVSSLLEKSDWLSMTQQDALVTLKMRQLISEMEDQPRTTRNAEVLIRSLEVLGNRLEKRSQAVESDLTRLYQWQGQLFIEAVTMVMEHVQRRVSEIVGIQGSEPTDSQWNQIVEEGIRRAGVLLANHEVSDDGVPIITSVAAPHGVLREPAGLPSAEDASASATAHRSASA